jgi:hypothetical protein
MFFEVPFISVEKLVYDPSNNSRRPSSKDKVAPINAISDKKKEKY